VLQSVACCCSVLQNTGALAAVEREGAVGLISVLQCVAACCSALQRVAECRSMLYCTPQL